MSEIHPVSRLTVAVRPSRQVTQPKVCGNTNGVSGEDKCVNCQYEAPHSYNSCRSRCCPKCQAQERRRWLEAQQRDLLNTSYFHVVFTLPHELNPLALTSPRPFLDLLFDASSQTLLEVAADPKWLGAEIGFLSILHTWSQTLLGHYHVHCVVPGGGLSPDHQRWISTSHPLFLLPIPVLHNVFRKKFLAGLRQLYRKNLLDCRGPAADFRDPAWFEQRIEALSRKDWYVYAKPPFGGPEHVLAYLGRYTHRMAISNVWSAAVLQAKNEGDRIGLRKCIRP